MQQRDMDGSGWQSYWAWRLWVTARGRFTPVHGRNDVPVQMPYEPPPKELLRLNPFHRIRNRCSPEEIQRAEALLPLLEGKQEFWAMGEFVHLGEPACRSWSRR